MVSASNIDNVELYFSGSPVREEFFTQTEKDVICDCDYGLQSAKELNTTWRASERQFSCNDVTYYDGTYECHSTATTAGVQQSNISVPVYITTDCK